MIRLSDAEKNYFLDFKDWSSDKIDWNVKDIFEKSLNTIGTDKFNDYIENYGNIMRKANKAFRNLVNETRDLFISLFNLINKKTSLRDKKILITIDTLFYEWKRGLDSRIKYK